MKVWEYYLKVWKKITRPIKLGKFPNEQFDVTGRMMTEMLLETVQFRSEFHQKIFATQKLFSDLKMTFKIISSIGTYPELSENCYMGDWTFDNSFLFMGSMATTIGYGHIVPQEMAIFDYRWKNPKKNHKCVLVENDHLKDRWRAYALHFIHIICSAIICNLTPGSDSLIIWTNQIDRNIIVREHSLMRRRMII